METVQKFYFNTGVKSWNNSFIAEGDKFVNYERHILFECQGVPEGSKLAFLCDNPDLYKEIAMPYHVAKVIGGNMHSKYAYFSLPKP